MSRLAIHLNDAGITLSDGERTLRADWVAPGSFYSHVGGWEDEYEVAASAKDVLKALDQSIRSENDDI